MQLDSTTTRFTFSILTINCTTVIATIACHAPLVGLVSALKQLQNNNQCVAMFWEAKKKKIVLCLGWSGCNCLTFDQTQISQVLMPCGTILFLFPIILPSEPIGQRLLCEDHLGEYTWEGLTQLQQIQNTSTQPQQIQNTNTNTKFGQTYLKVRYKLDNNNNTPGKVRHNFNKYKIQIQDLDNNNNTFEKVRHNFNKYSSTVINNFNLPYDFQVKAGEEVQKL